MAAEATVEAEVVVSGEDAAPADLGVTYEVGRHAAGQLQLTELCVRGKPDASCEQGGLPTFSAQAAAMQGLCQFSQMPALDTMAVELVLKIQVNALCTVRSKLCFLLPLSSIPSATS